MPRLNKSSDRKRKSLVSAFKLIKDARHSRKRKLLVSAFKDAKHRRGNL